MADEETEIIGAEPESEIVMVEPEPMNAGTGPQWDYRQRFFYTQGYTNRLAVGYGNDVAWGRGIHLQKDAPYPTNYRIANGQNGGGFPPSGARAKGTEPIKIQPNTSGVGRLKFITHCQVWVRNPDASKTGSFAIGLGVADVNGPHFPMWPYIGVGHYLEMNQMPASTVRPGDTVNFYMHRYDQVDNAFMSGNDRITTWPNWEMKPNTSNKLWPAVTPLIQNRGQTVLDIVGIWIIAYPTL